MQQGNFERAARLARDGRALTTDPEWRELFSILEADVTCRQNPQEALAILARTLSGGLPNSHGGEHAVAVAAAVASRNSTSSSS